MPSFWPRPNEEAAAVVRRAIMRAASMAWALLIPLASGTSPAVADALSPQREGELTRLVRQDCGSCHGLTLKGGLGKALLPEQLAPLGSEQIADIILEGLAGTPMPPWKSLLSRDDALWIATHLKEGFPQ